MKSLALLTLIACAIFALCGCGRESVGKSGASTVFASVAGRDITVDSVSNRVMILAKVRESQGKKLLPGQFPYWANACAMTMIPALVTSTRFDMMLKERRIDATPESDAAVLAKYNRLFKSDFKSAGEVAHSLGALGDTFLEQFAHESRMEAYYASATGLNVTERDVHRYYVDFTNRVNMAKAKNASSWLKANETYERLVAHGDWDEIAQASTEEGKSGDESAKNYWSEWDSLALKDIQPQALAEAVARLEPGQFTKPIETDEGIVIVKFIEKTEEDLYRCARILFELAIEPEQIPESKLGEYLAQKKRARRQYSLLDDLKEDYPATFPLGTNFVYKIWHEPKRLRKGFNMLQ